MGGHSVAYLLDVVTPNGDWAERLFALVSRAVKMGCPRSTWVFLMAGPRIFMRLVGPPSFWVRY